MSDHHALSRFAGVPGGILGGLAGLIVGLTVGAFAPLPSQAPAPLWLCIPFALLLACIAVTPLLAAKFWHSHYPAVALSLGGLVLGYHITGLGGPGGVGSHDMLHAAVEYYQFIALVGGLYVASGGILITIRGRATPMRNAMLLVVGAVLANVLGTTGASVLLIRPYMRMNRGRLRPFHVVMFIFIVSNCGGALTPVGDPPLYLGFLKGVPFWWTLHNLWPMWLLVNGMLLLIFVIGDARIPRSVTVADAEGSGGMRIYGWPSIACLLLLVAGVFIDPLLHALRGATLAHVPIGATFQIAMAVAAYRLARPDTLRANQFTFEPVREVGFLFAGIFLTMVPALAFLRTNASSLGLETPTQFYFFTGALSAVLDNAPTYLSFLQTALGAAGLPMDAAGIQQLLATTGPNVLAAISLGAVFFGAATYIGNGPNFMVRSIVESSHANAAKDAAGPSGGLGTRMPNFGAYVLYAVVLLVPVLVLNWLVFIR